MSNLEVVAWINKDGTYVDLATKSTVYGSHTIPLVRQFDALAVIAEFAHALRATERTVIEQGELLQSVVRAIRGDPAYGCSHSVHDAPELALSAMHRITELEAENARLRGAEPFGHFRAHAFGWEDCAADDDGAVALYERPDHSEDSRTMVDWPADDKRIEQIGQNGGDGLHYGR